MIMVKLYERMHAIIWPESSMIYEIWYRKNESNEEDKSALMQFLRIHQLCAGIHNLISQWLNLATSGTKMILTESQSNTIEFRKRNQFSTRAKLNGSLTNRTTARFHNQS